MVVVCVNFGRVKACFQTFLTCCVFQTGMLGTSTEPQCTPEADLDKRPSTRDGKVVKVKKTISKAAKANFDAAVQMASQLRVRVTSCEYTGAPNEVRFVLEVGALVVIVKVGPTPECTCKDFTTAKTYVPCVHMYWVFLKELRCSSTEMAMHQTTLSHRELNLMFSRCQRLPWTDGP